MTEVLLCLKTWKIKPLSYDVPDLFFSVRRVYAVPRCGITGFSMLYTVVKAKKLRVI